ncbi:beta propeller repeat protein [Klebsiella aerogenes]|uniref:hypothetical protein n=1 Tax=Klebsiella aerogenes TaxID=548 RepID=UPI002278458A|nr:hypothetical protein [Klebsiella aerogenes]MCY4766227.1 exo-alpha-sialidase [Klebsiella aerogenes]
MFSTLKRRLLCLALTAFIAFLWSATFLFNLFLPDLTWHKRQHSGPAMEVEQPDISSFRGGALIISHQPLFTTKGYELDNDRVIQHFNPPLERLPALMPKLLNARIIAREQLEQGIESRYQQLSYRPQRESLNVPLTTIMRLNKAGQMESSAFWLGNITSITCTLDGHCYLMAQEPFAYTQSVWFTEDGGINWQPLTQWQFPQSDSDALPGRQRLVSATDTKIWLASHNTLFMSEDQGSHWAIAADIRPLLKRHHIRQREEEGDHARLSALHWYVDSRQQIFADVSVLLADGIEQKRFLYHLLSAQQEQIVSTDFDNITCSPQGTIFFSSRISRTRFALYQLSENGVPIQRLEHIDRLGKISAGRKLLALEKGHGDGAHLFLSRDGGENWQRYQAIGKNTVFDGWGDRFIRFPQYSRSLEYQIGTIE